MSHNHRRAVVMALIGAVAHGEQVSEKGLMDDAGAFFHAGPVNGWRIR